MTIASVVLGLVKESEPRPNAVFVQMTIDTATGSVRETALLDSGAEVNLVSALAAKEWGWKEVNTPIIMAEAINKAPLRVYGAYEGSTTSEDQEGSKRTSTDIFLAVDVGSYNIVLGYPWHAKWNPDVQWTTGTWRYRAAELDNIEIVDPEEFVDGDLGGKAPRIYALVVNTVADDHHLRDDTVPKEWKDFNDVFTDKSLEDLPSRTAYDHAIELVGGQPPHLPIYNLSENELSVLREYLDDSLRKGWIRHSKSPAGAPILFVPKKDGGLRLCVDYRGLNQVTLKNRYPLPLISETLDRLAGAAVYTKLDLKDAYHRIRIKQGDEWKTAFRTRYGHFEYQVLPFGLANAPATFQGYINRALSNLLDRTCVVYLDDILIYSEKEEDHQDHVAEVLQRLRLHNLFANLKKCKFRTKEVEFLGYVVSTEGVRMEEARVTAVREWPLPTSFREIQVFLGFANFYRRFIKNYSTIAAPMSSMLTGMKNGKKTGEFIFTKEAEEAFRALQMAFTTAPVLRHFDPSGKVRVETDASGYAIAGILSQPAHEDVTVQLQAHWHPVAFWSRKMIPAERNYETYDQELLAIVEAFKHWRHYLEGSRHPVAVLTDHANLRYFMTTKTLNRRQSHWAQTLSAYDFEIVYRKGKTNPADAPSRRPDYEAEAKTKDDGELLLPTLQNKLRGSTPGKSMTDHSHSGRVTLATTTLKRNERGLVEGSGELQHLMPRIAAIEAVAGTTAYKDLEPALLETLRITQEKDSSLHDMRKKLHAGEKPPQWSIDHTGVIRHNRRIAVPQDRSLKQEILKSIHDDPYAGHFSSERTIELLRRNFWWPQLRKDVVDYVQTCDICQRTKSKRHRPYGELQALPRPERPWSDISMDFVTGLPPSKKTGGTAAYDSILVIVDRYTKMVKYIPAKTTITADELATTLADRILWEYGIPKSIVSDRGSLFTSKFWSALCFYAKIRRRLSTAFHPQTDGQTERQNQVLEHYLRTYCNYRQDDWADHLRPAEYAYNNAKHASTGISPFMALMGYNPTFSPDLEAELPGEGVQPARARLIELTEMRNEANRFWEAAMAYQVKYYNATHKSRHYHVGNMVMLNAKNLKLQRPSRKLEHKFIGPFEVEATVGSQAYRLQLPPMYKALHPVFHVSILEPYHQRPGEELQRPAPIRLDEADEWEVEAILDHKTERGKAKYHVKWLGYPPSENTWEPENVLENAKEVLHAYKCTHPATATQLLNAYNHRRSGRKGKRKKDISAA